MASTQSFVPQSHLLWEVISVTAFQTQSDGAAEVRNLSREGKIRGNPELQAIAWSFPGQKPALGSCEAGFTCLQDLLRTVCWCFPGSFADMTGIRIGLSRPNSLINNACVCSGSFPGRSKPSSSKRFSAESESINALQPVSIVYRLWHFSSEKVRCANTVMPSYGDVPASEETFGQDLC